MQKIEDGIAWLDDVEDHNYPAAESYLLLLYSRTEVSRLITGLRKAKAVKFKAKDIFRASQLSLLGVSKNGTPLSPLLLVRDGKHGKVIIADGYHRLCAIYGFDEDAWIRCKIV